MVGVQRSYGTGTFVVNCTSTGQVCARRHRDVGSLVLQVVRNGHIHIPKGASKLGFRAKGFLGGCNTGRVGSWGGRITVKVKLKG